ncbi:MAG TPA: hypothetical protein VLL77_06605 [Anaerolineales bacterium]|nr:hypothetical protein [Anaerolineales bacterium]
MGEQSTTIGKCPSCGSPHASGAETCLVCGEPLTGVARILTSPAAPRQPRWLDQNRQRAGDLKRTEASAAEERMASFREIDRRRLEHERAMAAQTASRERRAMILAGVVIGLIAVIGGLVVIAFLLF